MELQGLGIYNEKRIPESYQRLTVELRLQLLAGLIDTDGSTDENSRVTYTSARKELAEDVFELARGLGLRPYMQSAEPTLSTSGIQGRQVIWIIGFQPTGPIPCAVPHKAPARFAAQRKVGFKDVRHDPQGKVGRCIQVDRPDGLYLIGDKLTVTHNSELASRMFPAWHLGRHPDHEIIACSYNVSLALSFSRKVKETIQDPSYESVFAARLNPNHQSAEEWGIEGTRGGYVAAGVGGGITGKGCNILVVDDPLKSAEEADSADIREKLFDWYGSTAYTRLAPGGGVLVIQTCWHDDDLAGRLQLAMSDPDADQFEIVKYPAVAEQDEWVDTETDEIIRIHVAGGEDLTRTQEDAAKEVSAQGHDLTRLRFLRVKGDALHPERYDRIKLNRIKKTIQPRFWSALYQQNPVPDDGAYFLKEHFKRAPLPPIKRSNVYIAFDFAISEKKQNDYTVGTVGLQDDDDVLHVAEVLRFKSGDALFIVDSILGLCRRWYSSNLVLGFEDGQIYKTMAVLLKKRMQEEKFYPSIQVLVPVTDKMARARPLQGRMQQGMVSFNEQGEWYDVVRQEMLRFPAGVHDDCVDSLAWMTHLCMGRAAPRKIKKEAEKSWKDKLKGMGSRGAGHMAA